MGKIIFPWGLALTVVLSGSPFFFPHLKQKRPELTVQIYDTFDGKMENLIETNEIDAGVMSSIPLSQKLSYIPIGTQRIFLSVPMGSPRFRWT